MGEVQEQKEAPKPKDPKQEMGKFFDKPKAAEMRRPRNWKGKTEKKEEVKRIPDRNIDITGPAKDLGIAQKMLDTIMSDKGNVKIDCTIDSCQFDMRIRANEVDINIAYPGQPPSDTPDGLYQQRFGVGRIVANNKLEFNDSFGAADDLALNEKQKDFIVKKLKEQK